jgi:pimeloyl-ACP methyl ester carboxylesterase
MLTTIILVSMIIYGAHDIVPNSSLDIYLENISNSPLKTIHNSAHFPFDDQADEFGALAGEFLNNNTQTLLP